MIPEGFVVFTHRFGLADYPRLSQWCEYGGENLVEELWRSRHSMWMTVSASVERHAAYVEPLFRCTCPGSALRREDPTLRCAQRASQEDRLCDYCREWCWAVDGERNYHRLVDVYGAAT